MKEVDIFKLLQEGDVTAEEINNMQEFIRKIQENYSQVTSGNLNEFLMATQNLRQPESIERFLKRRVDEIDNNPGEYKECLEEFESSKQLVFHEATYWAFALGQENLELMKMWTDITIDSNEKEL